MQGHVQESFVRSRKFYGSGNYLFPLLQRKFHCSPRQNIEVNRKVYCIGSDRSKPPVILLHELTGLSVKTLEYAESLSTDFTVYVPMLFGDLNQNSVLHGTIAFLFNGEWGWPLGGLCLDSNTSLVKWLKHVVATVEKEHKGKPIGVIGHCLTGSLPLSSEGESLVKKLKLDVRVGQF